MVLLLLDNICPDGAGFGHQIRDAGFNILISTPRGKGGRKTHLLVILETGRLATEIRQHHLAALISDLVTDFPDRSCRIVN
jgi:hypothetical protein